MKSLEEAIAECDAVSERTLKQSRAYAKRLGGEITVAAEAKIKDEIELINAQARAEGWSAEEYVDRSMAWGIDMVRKINARKLRN